MRSMKSYPSASFAALIKHVCREYGGRLVSAISVAMAHQSGRSGVFGGFSNAAVPYRPSKRTNASNGMVGGRPTESGQSAYHPQSSRSPGPSTCVRYWEPRRLVKRPEWGALMSGGFRPHCGHWWGLSRFGKADVHRLSQYRNSLIPTLTTLVRLAASGLLRMMQRASRHASVTVSNAACPIPGRPSLGCRRTRECAWPVGTQSALSLA
jgi:hypothetical protein